MKKRTFSFLLALVMCLSLLPMTALAALPDKIDAPQNPKAALDDNVPGAFIDYTDEIIISFGLTDAHRALLAGDAAAMILQVDWSINSETDWKCSGQDTWIDSLRPEYGKDAVTLTNGDIVDQIAILRSNYNMPADNGYAHICHGIDDSGNGWLDLENNTLYFKLRFVMRDYDDNKVYSDWTDVFTIGKEVDKEEFEASEWAQEELARADEFGLIPDCLDGADLTADITRAEFAAVAVKVYEALSGTAAIPIVNNPFTDTGDVEVLKAYNIGAVNGTSATTYEPNALLNREQAATMLTRVFKKVTMAGWTLATDSQFTLPYTKPAAFADDKDISDWAKDSVYFMSANGIVGGVGNGKFAPKNITTEEQATGYANATREQALLIAVRMVENLGK
ncbi:MAG: S-layer homology domain-containing protein [Firmicutes bacterium]|nr:S-layer homology domain-containing protein [Bacillota bacterium]